MTPIGHTLTGLAIGYCAIPDEVRGKRKVAALAVFALLASAPDLPLPYWGHDHYAISHSLVVTTFATALIALLLIIFSRGKYPFTPRMLFGGILAWYSHILLDMMYNGAIGLHISWPWPEYRVALPVPWLATADREHVFSWHNVRVAILEMLTFGTLLAVVLGIKHWTRHASHIRARVVTSPTNGNSDRI